MGEAAERKRARSEARRKAEEEAARPPAHEATVSMLQAIDDALDDLGGDAA